MLHLNLTNKPEPQWWKGNFLSLLLLLIFIRKYILKWQIFLCRLCKCPKNAKTKVTFGMHKDSNIWYTKLQVMFISDIRMEKKCEWELCLLVIRGVRGKEAPDKQKSISLGTKHQTSSGYNTKSQYWDLIFLNEHNF